MKIPTGIASPWEATRSKCIEAAGNVTQSFGFGRSIGHLYALLYLNPKPLCLDEIVSELGFSKASASTIVRQLENWAAVQRVWVKGDRKDYYEAVSDFSAVLRHGVLTRFRRKLDSAGSYLQEAEKSLQETLDAVSQDERREAEALLARLQRAKDFHSKLSGILSDPVLEHFL